VGRPLSGEGRTNVLKQAQLGAQCPVAAKSRNIGAFDVGLKCRVIGIGMGQRQGMGNRGLVVVPEGRRLGGEGNIQPKGLLPRRYGLMM
jgi:hypothetical protein